MKEKQETLYDEETLEFCRHIRIFANVDRIRIVKTIKEYKRCRVTQLVMETGLTYRQVYYQLSVLRKLDYISTRYDKGRYIINLGFGWSKGQDVLKAGLESLILSSKPKMQNYGNLKIVQ